MQDYNLESYQEDVYTTVNHSQLMDPSSMEFLLQVYLPIAIWMGGIIILIILLLRRYTFGQWSEDNPNPYSGETFSMPRGVFRGLVTLTLLFVVIFLELVSVHVIGFEMQITELLVAFHMMIAFYFGSKVMHHITSADRTKTVEIASAQAEVAQVAAQGTPAFTTNSSSSNRTSTAAPVAPAAGEGPLPEEDLNTDDFGDFNVDGESHG